MLEDYLILMMENKCSDLHLTAGLPPVFRKDGILVKQGEIVPSFLGKERLFTKEVLDNLVEEIIPSKKYDFYLQWGEVDFPFSLPGVGRFRINVFQQRGCASMAIRAIPIEVPSLTSLNMPHIIGEFGKKPNGLVLVTGPTGSGKSTTLAALIDLINKERSCHIITLEDPIEYLHNHQKSIINQREIGTDTQNFANGLRAALRQDPDVILVGEMRDLETIEVALKAAETGHLVLATLHTNSAVQTIDRIVDVFPANQQQQVKIQLASVLQGIISQKLLPLVAGGRTAVQEILIANTAVRSLIREGKTHQIFSVIQTSSKEGMITFANALKKLVAEGKVSLQAALGALPDDEELKALVQVGDNDTFFHSELI